MTPSHLHRHKTPRIFISAAEPSADLHAASLIRRFREIHPNARFVGLAGPRMRDQNCQTIADMTASAAMITGVLGSVGRAAAAMVAIDREFSTRRYDAAILLDSPMLNFPIALRARMRAIPVLYYIAPQLWAWGAYRLHKLRARIDKLAVVLPFEEQFFRHGGIDATFVGHPLFDALHDAKPNPHRVAEIKSAGHPIVAILPGSRKHVISEVLTGQLEVARAVRERFPNVHIGVSVADTGVRDIIASRLDETRIPATLYQKENADLLTAADLTLVASGTATLEVAYYGSPMIVMYNGSRLMYHLVGRWMIQIDHLSLVNILADRSLVPEFMPYYTTTHPIARAAIDLLARPDALAEMRRDLADTIAPINKRGASARTARLLDGMINSA